MWSSPPLTELGKIFFQITSILLLGSSPELQNNTSPLKSGTDDGYIQKTMGLKKLFPMDDELARKD